MEKLKEAEEEAKRAYEKRLTEIAGDIASRKEAYAKKIKEIKEREADYKTRKANADKWLAQYETNNPENNNTKNALQLAEQHNKKCAAVSDYISKRKQADEKQSKVDELKEQLSALTTERETLINSAKLPISGLSFSDDGLQLDGIPFAPGNVSDSQIMEVAAKLIVACNPTVKVFRIARGESLGAQRLKAIVDMAKANGFQGFIEEVVREQDDLQVEEYTEV